MGRGASGRAGGRGLCPGADRGAEQDKSAAGLDCAWDGTVALDILKRSRR